jgi:prepilin-type N-terminal cleavage/methylation domain-containing protein
MGRNSGFTLTELMVVVAIVGVMAVIAIPNFIVWLPKYKLNSGTNDIQAMIQAARLQSIKAKARVVVLFDPDADGNLEGDYLAFVDDGVGGGNEWTRQPATEHLVKSGHLPVGVNFTGTTFAGNRFRYNSRGIVDGINGSIRLINSRGATKQITVYVSGNSKIR